MRTMGCSMSSMPLHLHQAGCLRPPPAAVHLPACPPPLQVVTAQSIKAAQAQSQTQLGAAAAAGDVGAGVALAAGFPAGAAPQSSLVRRLLFLMLARWFAECGGWRCGRPAACILWLVAS